MTGPTSRKAGVPPVGAVVIGRNEGARLLEALRSVRPHVAATVYVDSGSTDGSVAAARAEGAMVEELDTNTPFTAARARNVGLARLSKSGRFDLVQFIDGDCLLDPGWIDVASAFLDGRPRAAAACGRRREDRPGASIYNRLCDMEWNTPPGQAAACGGDAIYRMEALEASGGFDPALIAGEEPDLCLRLRQAGWEIWRLDAEMTRHDAAMTKASQWWRRMIRSGWAYAEGAARYGAGPEAYNRRAVWRIWLWAVIVPAVILLAGATLSPWAVPALLAIYPAMAVRIAVRRRRSHADPWPHAFLWAVASQAAKWPQLVGLLRYRRNRARGGTARIIEYKAP